MDAWIDRYVSRNHRAVKSFKWDVICHSARAHNFHNVCRNWMQFSVLYSGGLQFSVDTSYAYVWTLTPMVKSSFGGQKGRISYIFAYFYVWYDYKLTTGQKYKMLHIKQNRNICTYLYMQKNPKCLCLIVFISFNFGKTCLVYIWTFVSVKLLLAKRLF